MTPSPPASEVKLKLLVSPLYHHQNKSKKSPHSRNAQRQHRVVSGLQEDRKKLLPSIQSFFFPFKLRIHRSHEHKCRSVPATAAPLLYASTQIGPLNARRFYHNSNAFPMIPIANMDGSNSTKWTAMINQRLPLSIQEVRPIWCVQKSIIHIWSSMVRCA